MPRFTKTNNPQRAVKELTGFLKEKAQATSTIKNATNMLLLFFDWLNTRQLPKEELTYGDVLAYMQHLQNRGVSQRTVAGYLQVIKQYYAFLEEQHRIAVNPLTHIRVKGMKRKTTYRILEPLELSGLYAGFLAITDKDKRDKVLIGLLVYQGLSTTDLSHLEITHVQIREGKVQVPGSKRCNERTLELEPAQVLDLYDYIMQVRPRLLAVSGEITQRLLVNTLGGERINSMVHRMCRLLKAQNPLVENAAQLRASVIVKWIKACGLRRAQYLCGHRFISSTESYRQNDMEGLVEEVNQFHPLG